MPPVSHSGDSDLISVMQAHDRDAAISWRNTLNTWWDSFGSWHPQCHWYPKPGKLKASTGMAKGDTNCFCQCTNLGYRFHGQGDHWLLSKWYRWNMTSSSTRWRCQLICQYWFFLRYRPFLHILPIWWSVFKKRVGSYTLWMCNHATGEISDAPSRCCCPPHVNCNPCLFNSWWIGFCKVAPVPYNGKRHGAYLTAFYSEGKVIYYLSELPER